MAYRARRVRWPSKRLVEPISTLTSAARTIGRSNSRAPRGTRRSSAGCSTNCRVKWSGGVTGRDASNSPPLTESGNQQILSKQPQGRDRAVFHQLQQNAAGGIQADSEARRCRGDEVSKGQHCKSRKEKTLEVRVQVSRSPQLGFREPSNDRRSGHLSRGTLELAAPPERRTP